MLISVWYNKIWHLLILFRKCLIKELKSVCLLNSVNKEYQNLTNYSNYVNNLSVSCTKFGFAPLTLHWHCWHGSESGVNSCPCSCTLLSYRHLVQMGQHPSVVDGWVHCTGQVFFKHLTFPSLQIKYTNHHWLKCSSYSYWE